MNIQSSQAYADATAILRRGPIKPVKQGHGPFVPANIEPYDNPKTRGVPKEATLVALIDRLNHIREKYGDLPITMPRSGFGDVFINGPEVRDVHGNLPSHEHFAGPVEVHFLGSVFTTQTHKQNTPTGD